MSLLAKIEECLSFGYDVAFKRSVGFIHIRLINSDTGEMDEQALPDRIDHINEAKIKACIDFMLMYKGREEYLQEQSEQETWEDSYQEALASEVWDKYEKGVLFWTNEWQQTRRVQDMTVHHIKKALKVLEEEDPNQAAGEFIKVFKQELKNRITDDFKDCV